MNRTLQTIFLATALTAASSQAQSPLSVAKVPFAFQVGDVVMPAGTYEVHDSSLVLTLREIHSNATLFRIIHPASKEKMPGENKLRFARYGNEYFLTSIWNSARQTGDALPTCKREKQLEDQSRNLEIASVTFLTASR